MEETNEYEGKELETICNIVNEYFDVNIRSSAKIRDVADKRIIYSKIARVRTPYGLIKIGEEINKDHTTIIHHLKQFDAFSKYDKAFKKDYINCLKRVPIFKDFREASLNDLLKLQDSINVQSHWITMEIKERQQLKEAI